MIRGNHVNRAFSLTELLVVLLIVGVLSTAAIVTYANTLRNTSLRQGSEKIKSILVQARTQAIADNLPTQVVFDLDNDQFWVDLLESNGDIRSPKAIPPESIGELVDIDRVAVDGASSQTGYISARFEPTGVSPLIRVNIRREIDAADANDPTNFYTIRMWPNSAVPKVDAREKL